MEELLKQISLVEEEVKRAETDYANECVELTKCKGFDLELKKWKRKVDKIANKYADIIIELKRRYNELRDLANEKEEEIRKSKYKDI